MALGKFAEQVAILIWVIGFLGYTLKPWETFATLSPAPAFPTGTGRLARVRDGRSLVFRLGFCRKGAVGVKILARPLELNGDVGPRPI